MGKLSEIQALIEKGTNQFIAICTNANRDLPFHDFHYMENANIQGMYVVGSNNISGVGDQKKFFVSKSTLFFATNMIIIRLNSYNNCRVIIMGNTFYEFKSNIHSVFWEPAQPDTELLMWFEGVMYHEARRPE